MHRILDLVPIYYTEGIKGAVEDRKKLGEELRLATGNAFSLEIEFLRAGTPSIESSYDEYIDGTFILEKVIEAEKKGFSAIVIDCFGDPALDAAREAVSIPVLGANIAAMSTARLLADRFSVINILPETEPLIWRLASKYGFLNSLVSIETINVPVLELESKMEEVVRSAKFASIEAIRKGAQAIVLGCTGMSYMQKSLSIELKKDGLEIPIIEPLRAAIASAVSIVLQGLTHSKKAYPQPRNKERKFEIPSLR